MWIWNLVFGFGIGMILGSLVKALADRSIYQVGFLGRSYCPECKKTLRWYDLFPILSYLLLRGRCRYCKKPIPIAYLLVEVLMGVAISLVFLTSLGDLSYISNPNYLIALVFKCFFVVILGIIFLVDLKVGLIPDRITYPSVLITLVYLILSLAQVSDWQLVNFLLKIGSDLSLAVISAVLASASFIFLIVVTRGRGMGWGDVKYVFFLALGLSFPKILVAIFLSFFIGAIFSVGLILLKKRKFGATIPFGPFLSIGAFIALLWGNQILDFYLRRF